MNCRSGCGACCIAPSISSPIPGMPAGKRAGERCVQLTVDQQCRLFGHPDRPEVCTAFAPSPDMCADDRNQAIIWLTALERATLP